MSRKNKTLQLYIHILCLQINLEKTLLLKIFESPNKFQFIPF